MASAAERRSVWSVVLYATVVGCVAGIALDVLGFVVARFGPVGDGWSFRGNGALVVPLGLGPAALAAGWTALVLRARGCARWWAFGLAAGLVGVLVVLASVVALVAFGVAGMGISNVMSLLAFAWPIVALAVAAAVPLAGPGPRPSSWRAHAVAGLGLTLAVPAAFLAFELVLSPGS